MTPVHHLVLPRGRPERQGGERIGQQFAIGYAGNLVVLARLHVFKECPGKLVLGQVQKCIRDRHDLQQASGARSLGFP